MSVRILVLGLLTALALSAGGCGGKLEQSSDAKPLPVATEDVPAQGASTGEAYWPMWRGPNSSGVSADKSLPVQFSATSGYRWRVDVPGAGNSSPVVWGDRIYLTAAVPAAEGAPEKLVVVCFDRRDGRQHWQAAAGTSAGATHAKNGHASASVVTDGRRVWASFGPSGLYCFDAADGKRLWRVELGTLDHQWGTASSPVLFENLVIQLCDVATGSYLATFDRETGSPAWRTPRDSYGCWTTPVLVEATTDDGANRTELIVNGTGTADSAGGAVIAYDPRTGHELWRASGTKDIVNPTLLVGDGLVYSLSGRNGPILAIRPGGSGDVTKTRVVWKQPKGGPYVPSGVLYRNRLFTIGDGGIMAAYNAGNGEAVWQKRLGGNFTASLVAGDGHLYAIDERGTLHVVSAADQFEPVSECELDERCLATPAIAAGEMIVRTESHLTCFPSPAPAPVVASP